MATVSPKHRFLDNLSVSYLKSQIETGRPDRTKKALQELCELYRGGARVRPDQQPAVEQSILGLIYSQRKDEKVRRWALNTLARLGRESTCLEAIKDVLADFRHEPQTIAAAIAALYRLSRKPQHVLKTLDFDNQMVTLAALQHAKPSTIDLSPLPLNVDKASADLLKLALVLVGLDRAPVNMLNPRHSNAEMVKALGRHHGEVVSQYTVWAITENDSLGVADLGIDIKDIEQQPPNVRAWMFKLLAMTPEDAQRYQEYVVLGSGDPDAEARFGLAGGLGNTFFDGLETVVLDWFVEEGDLDVSQLLMDHMIRQARHCSHYEALVLEFYEKEAPGSPARYRMEARAARTPLYTKMRQLDFGVTQDLFRGVSIVTNNITIGGIQAGAVAVGGNAENNAPVNIHYNPQTVELLQSELAKADRELRTGNIPDSDLKREALQRVTDANANPTPDRLGKVVDLLTKIDNGTSKAVGIATTLGTIAGAIGKAAGLL